jgi:hypothetical protein
MVGHSDDWIENRILRSLGKRDLPDGREVHGRETFSSLPADMRALADSTAAGRAVVGFVGSELQWALLGTDAVWSRQGERVVRVKLDDIREVALVGATLVPRQPCEYIEVNDYRDERLRLWGPPGEGCLALCGVLQILIRLQQHTQR